MNHCKRERLYGGQYINPPLLFPQETKKGLLGPRLARATCHVAMVRTTTGDASPRSAHAPPAEGRLDPRPWPQREEGRGRVALAPGKLGPRQCRHTRKDRIAPPLREGRGCSTPAPGRGRYSAARRGGRVAPRRRDGSSDGGSSRRAEREKGERQRWGAVARNGLGSGMMSSYIQMQTRI